MPARDFFSRMNLFDRDKEQPNLPVGNGGGQAVQEEVKRPVTRGSFVNALGLLAQATAQNQRQASMGQAVQEQGQGMMAERYRQDLQDAYQDPRIPGQPGYPERPGGPQPLPNPINTGFDPRGGRAQPLTEEQIREQAIVDELRTGTTLQQLEDRTLQGDSPAEQQPTVQQQRPRPRVGSPRGFSGITASQIDTEEEQRSFMRGQEARANTKLQMELDEVERKKGLDAIATKEAERLRLREGLLSPKDATSMYLKEIRDREIDQGSPLTAAEKQAIQTDVWGFMARTKEFFDSLTPSAGGAGAGGMGTAGTGEVGAGADPTGEGGGYAPPNVSAERLPPIDPPLATLRERQISRGVEKPEAGTVPIVEGFGGTEDRRKKMFSRGMNRSIEPNPPISPSAFQKYIFTDKL